MYEAPTSPWLPLPVESVAGGEGSPELVVPPGLGGSGKSGTGDIPRNIADEGRRLRWRVERAVGVDIGRAWGKESGVYGGRDEEK
jgi:hypothetical protein